MLKKKRIRLLSVELEGAKLFHLLGGAINIIKEERKHPSEMVNKELLEAYSHYNRIYQRSPEEQDYMALLRRELLELHIFIKIFFFQ